MIRHIHHSVISLPVHASLAGSCAQPRRRRGWLRLPLPPSARCEGRGSPGIAFFCEGFARTVAAELGAGGGRAKIGRQDRAALP
jgi:hypothetical protein